MQPQEKRLENTGLRQGWPPLPGGKKLPAKTFSSAFWKFSFIKQYFENSTIKSCNLILFEEITVLIGLNWLCCVCFGWLNFARQVSIGCFSAHHTKSVPPPVYGKAKSGNSLNMRRLWYLMCSCQLTILSLSELFFFVSKDCSTAAWKSSLAKYCIQNEIRKPGFFLNFVDINLWFTLKEKTVSQFLKQIGFVLEIWWCLTTEIILM